MNFQRIQVDNGQDSDICVHVINDRLSQRTQLRNEGRNLSRQFPQSDQ